MFTLLMSVALAADPGVSGTFRVAHSAGELQTLHKAAVDKALADLPWAFRGVARGPLSRAISNCGELVMDLQPSQLTLQCDREAEQVVTRPANGHTMHNAHGEEMTVVLVASQSELSVRFETEDGGVTTRYIPAGDTLRVHKTLFSHRLDEPVTWEVRYSRQAE